MPFPQKAKEVHFDHNTLVNENVRVGPKYYYLTYTHVAQSAATISCVTGVQGITCQ